MILGNKSYITFDMVLRRDKQGNINPAYPVDLLCKSGHIAVEGSRFFNVCGPNLPENVRGVYCENCVKTMNIIRRLQKKKAAKLL